MARIRSIKPELRISEVVAEWPREVRYGWVLLWGYLDDHGRGIDSPRLLASDLFPLDDDVTAAVIDEWLWRMATPGDHRSDAPLCRYEVDGRRFMHAVNWKEHQRPSHPARSRSPECPVHEGGASGSVLPPEVLRRTSGESPENLRRTANAQVDATTEDLPRTSGESREVLVPEQGAGSREQGDGAGGSVTTSPEREDLANAPEDDAQPVTVPDTRPAPLEEPTPDQPAPVHERAMPTDRCPNHRELTNPPPCGHCADARRAQATWITDRDAKIAAARAQVDAEHRAARAAERATIDACDRCDDRGVTPHAVVCTHDADADRTSPGRAEWRNARRQLEQRTTDRASTPAQPAPATGDQLRKLAISFGEHGTNDRDERLAWCTSNVGRDITSTTQLTKTEASALIDLLERPVPEPPADDDAVDIPVVDDEPYDDGLTDAQYADLEASWAYDDQPAYAHAGGPDDPIF